MKKTRTIAVLTMTVGVVLAVPTTASAQSPPPGAYKVLGMGGQVWGESALVGHGYRYPLKIKVTVGSAPAAGVLVEFFVRRAWDYGPGSIMGPTFAGPLFKTSKGLSDVGLAVSNSQGIATSPPVIAEGPAHEQWIEMTFVAPRTPAVKFSGPMWLLDVK